MIYKCKYPCEYSKNLCCHNCKAESKCSMMCSSKSETCGFSIKCPEEKKTK